MIEIPIVVRDYPATDTVPRACSIGSAFDPGRTLFWAYGIWWLALPCGVTHVDPKTLVAVLKTWGSEGIAI